MTAADATLTSAPSSPAPKPPQPPPTPPPPLSQPQSPTPPPSSSTSTEATTTTTTAAASPLSASPSSTIKTAVSLLAPVTHSITETITTTTPAAPATSQSSPTTVSETQTMLATTITPKPTPTPTTHSSSSTTTTTNTATTTTTTSSSLSLSLSSSSSPQLSQISPTKTQATNMSLVALTTATQAATPSCTPIIKNINDKITKLYLPVIERLFNLDVGEPFRYPVDVEKYKCFGYYDHVKHPIDLTTIMTKLSNRAYNDPWAVVADVQLMFDNAWLYNKRGTPVYDFTNKLNKIWQTELTPVMPKLGYCCSTLHKFGPQLLFCHGTTSEKYCQIAIGAKYKCYEDQYSFCIPCFTKIDSDYVHIKSSTCETVRMKLPAAPVKKSDFQDCTNDHWQYELFVKCEQCFRRVHQICELYPADEYEIQACAQHYEIEHKQRLQCKVPRQYRREEELTPSPPPTPPLAICAAPTSLEVALPAYSKRDKFVCNHCYTKETIGFNLRHRKWSARRLPHTRMSKYIETKVNEYIRECSPTAGEVTIRVLTTYRYTVDVKPEMREYISMCKKNASKEGADQSHPYLKDYPDQFQYSNRAILAWQEIDGVDVCVFGMHVQEYGEDCPEPNKQVVYLSYLDSVHFFRPKQFRTAVYHEILLSYFKYVKKLGFKRVFIWVCPSRKGDDYIFYRHPPEQKMPTLRRLSDWYVNLLDKGIIAGIVERHQNIYQYSSSQNWTSILSMPYLSGDFWPGEFERLLKSMIELKRQNEEKLAEQKLKAKQELFNQNGSFDVFDNTFDTSNNFNDIQGLSLALKNSFQMLSQLSNVNFANLSSLPSPLLADDKKYCNISTPGSSRSDMDQPLDLSKSSIASTPDCYIDDDSIVDISIKNGSCKRKKKPQCLGGYTKRRNNRSSAAGNSLNKSASQATGVSILNTRYGGQQRAASKSCTQQKETQEQTLLDPEIELTKSLERSLKRQKDGFIVAHLIDCDCSPLFETHRREEETLFDCELMRGREPLLQLSRIKNYEFSTLRRAKFSSLAMVKHFSETFTLDPICSICYSFDSSKRYYACNQCDDFYLCTFCYDNTQHQHPMNVIAPNPTPDIDDFLQPCVLGTVANSVSSASSTSSITVNSLSSSQNATVGDISSLDHSCTVESTFKNNTTTNSKSSAFLPLSANRQKNIDISTLKQSLDNKQTENSENATGVCKFPSSINDTKNNRASIHNQAPTSQQTIASAYNDNMPIELDQVLVENFIRQAEVVYDVDFDEMKTESKKMLQHYWDCSYKDNCHRCKFVLLSCSFMSALLKNSRSQMLVSNPPNASSRLTGQNSTLLCDSKIKESSRSWRNEGGDGPT